MTEALTNLTDKQRDTLVKFKESVRDVVKPEFADNDGYLLRWLVARNFDITKAEKMIREHMKWREKWDVDNIGKWSPPKVLEEYMPLPALLGTDRDGRPIFAKRAKNQDIRGIMMSAKIKDIVKYIIYVLEKLQRTMVEHNHKSGRPMDGALFIEDSEGLTLKMFFAPGLSELMKITGEIFEKNYPEFQKRTFVIHAPKIFPVVWNLVKPFLPEETKRKLQVLGSNFSEVLLKYIDEEELPVCYGGKMTGPDGDEYCYHKVKLPKTIPEEYYLSGAKMVEDESQIVTINVSKGSKLDLEFQVTSTGELLKWVFWTDSHDIGYGLFLKDREDQLVEVQPTERTSCHRVPEDGAIVCQATGTYIFQFDNSYSWVNGKKVHYVIGVENSPEDGDT